MPYKTRVLSLQLLEKQTMLSLARKRLKAVRQKYARLQTNVSKLESILKEIKGKFNIQDHIMDILKNCGSEIPGAFFRRLTKNLLSGKTTREEFPPALQSFALTLHFYSPKAYR